MSDPVRQWMRIDPDAAVPRSYEEEARYYDSKRGFDHLAPEEKKAFISSFLISHIKALDAETAPRSRQRRWATLWIAAMPRLLPFVGIALLSWAAFALLKAFLGL